MLLLYRYIKTTAINVIYKLATWKVSVKFFWTPCSLYSFLFLFRIEKCLFAQVAYKKRCFLLLYFSR